MPEQWQLTLDVIKSKAQSLMVENNGLQAEYQQLIGQVQKLQQLVDDQKNKNEQMNSFLKQRHGQTDQHARIEELTQNIKDKKKETRVFEEQGTSLERDHSDLERKIQQLKNTVSSIDLHQEPEKTSTVQGEPQAPIDDEMDQLRKRLEDENRQEVLLENELEGLKSGDKEQNLNVDVIESENKQLEARVDVLRLKKLQREKKSSGTVLYRANQRMYEKLKKRKDELEVNINAYESRLDDLRESSLMSLSWSLKKKRLIHEMVQTDARNNQMRDKIKELREDIDVLKDQVARLERREDFVKGQSTQ